MWSPVGKTNGDVLIPLRAALAKAVRRGALTAGEVGQSADFGERDCHKEIILDSDETFGDIVRFYFA